MKKEKKLSDYKNFLLPGIVTLLVFLTTLSFLKPKVAAIIEVQKKLSQNKKNLTLLTQKLAALEGLDQTELTKKTDLLMAALPSEKKVPQALIIFKNLALETGVELEEIQVDPGELDVESEEEFLSFNIKLSGSIEKIGTFFDKLEKTFPLMRLIVVDLSRPEGDLFNASLEVQSFFLSLPKTLGAAEEELSLVTPQEEAIYRRLVDFKAFQLKEELPLPLTQTGKENPFTF